MKKIVYLMILAGLFLGLGACAAQEQPAEEKEAENTAEETITVGFVNSVHTADLWILPDTQEIRKTSVWGTPTIKDSEQEKEYSVSISKTDDNSYLLRMIDTDKIYYESGSITLDEGYSIIVYSNEDDDMDIRLVIYDDKGEKSEECTLFNAAL